jgi:uncharacterized membrane protein YsdA (DUF1294 family)
MSHQSIIKGIMTVGLIGGVAATYALWQQGLPLWAAYLVSAGLVTFLCYGFDKHQAKVNRTRIPEAVLHVCALVGGTPGAFLGRLVFRHKTVKRSFRLVFWLIVAMQGLALAGWLVYR